MLRWLPLALTACATPPVVVAEGGSDRPIAIVPVDAATVTAPPSAPKVGLPAGALRQVTGPDDADFVVTTDSGGGLRLWPTLDGTREPVIVPTLRPASDAETIRDGDDIAVAVTDSIGQLEILRVRHDGVVLSDIDVDLERGVIALASTPHGFIVLRDDQRIVGLDSHGVARGEVTPDPGESVSNFVERSGHVLAIFTGTAKRRRGRMLELDERGVAWGARTAQLAIEPTLMALSPDGRRLVGVREHVPVVIEVATGHKVAAGITPYIATNIGIEPDMPAMVVFGDAHTVWFMQDGVSYEWPLAGQPSEIAADLQLAHVTAHAIVSPHGDALSLLANHKVRWLGYRTAAITDLIASGDGWIASDGAKAMRFAATFALDRVYPQPAEANVDVTMILLDAKHGLWHSDTDLFVVTFASNKVTAVPFSGSDVRYERASGLAELANEKAIQFAQWDPARGKFADKLVSFDPPIGPFVALELYDPVASGFVAATAGYAEDDSRHAQLTMIRSVEVAKPSPFRMTQRLVPLPPTRGGGELEDFRQALPHKARAATSFDHSLIAELFDGRITLHDREGNERWSRTQRGAVGLAWNQDDQLVAYGSGLAQVDLETGDFKNARCGWEFGLSDQPIENAGSSQMCEAP